MQIEDVEHRADVVKVFCLWPTPHLHTAVCWFWFILIVCPRTHIMLLIYSWFYTSWTLPEDEEIPEIFLNISGIIWIVLFILSQDWLWLHHILEEVTFSKSSWASTTYDVYNYLFHQQVFLSQHETNIHRILWLNRRWFYCVIPLHIMYSKSTIGWQRNEKYTFFKDVMVAIISQQRLKIWH